MKRTTRLGLFCLTLNLLTAIVYFTIHSNTLDKQKLSKEQRIEFAFQDNFERTKDPALGYPTYDKMPKVIDQVRGMQAEFAAEKGDFAKARFRERGPNNIGGRTRAILIDQNDPSGNTIWAGGVGGGLWKLESANAGRPQWEKVSDYLENLAVGAIAQDPNNPQVMYFGTGEAYPNADAINGYGCYRTLDGGETWELLPSTLNDNLRSVRAMVVHGETSDIYAGGLEGVWRSSDQGETWEKVLGVGFSAIDDIYDLQYVPTNKSLYASTANRVYRSETGDPRDWQDLSTIVNGFPRSSMQRIEMSVCVSNPDYIYLIGNQSGESSAVYRTTDAGVRWQKLGLVGGSGDFTNGQAWYDLDIAVDPFNPEHVIAAGVPIFRSLNGGISWDRFAFNMHVDQHTVVFDPDRRNVIYFGNDGGAFRSDNGSGPQVRNLNVGYNVTQFYACAFHPEAYSDYMLGGTQDNNSLQLNAKGIGDAVSVWGGDGMLCHIDQNEPRFQIVSSQFGNYGFSFDEGNSFGGGASSDGSFVNPSDYDNDANILYAQTNEGADYWRWNVETGNTDFVDVPNIGIGTSVSVVIADPTTDNRIYLGTFGSRGVYRIDNANTEPVSTLLSLPSNGTVSCIDIDKNDPNHLLVTLSSFGINDSVLESMDGGQNWIGVEGNLPDMPVRWCLFAPENSNQAVIATEAGIWLTEKLEGSSTTWLPPAEGIGSPLTRVDMLQLRESDKMLLAATHGRGLFTSDIFADAKVIFELQRIGYIDGAIRFDGTTSIGGSDYFWDFGDGKTSTDEVAIHSYDAIGEYEVNLSLNNEEVADKTSIKILPNKSLPYAAGESGYSGDFDSRPEDYGVHTISGSGFGRGQATTLGKNGTHSGDNAFVLGLEETFYQPNSHSILYLPNYDFSEEGIYEFSFWSKAFIQAGLDGYLVEFSIDKGATWQKLGDESPNWYNFTNRTTEQAAFDIDESYFSRNHSDWTRFHTDVTRFNGQSDVAFRFVFKSDGSGSHPGIVIDDVEITRFKGELETKIVAIDADYTSSEEVTVNWTTQPEYYAEQFIVERSQNGRDWERVGQKVEAIGRVSGGINNYASTIIGARNLYFFRVRSINENQSRGYYHEFVSPTVVVRRNIEGLDIFTLFPNPFTTFLDFTFNEVVESPVELQLFDAAGKLLREETIEPNGVYHRFETGDLPRGVYFLRYRIGEQESKVLEVMRM